MQFFHKNKSQPTLLNSVESAPHNTNDHSSVSSQNHHPHHNREGSQQHQYQQQQQHQPPQQQQQLYQQHQQHQQQHPANPHPQHTFQPATGSHELPSGTYQLGQHSNAASYTHPAHAGSRSENFSLPLQVSSSSAAAPYPSAAAAAAGGRPTLNLVPSASHQPDHSIDALSAAPALKLPRLQKHSRANPAEVSLAYTQRIRIRIRAPPRTPPSLVETSLLGRKLVTQSLTQSRTKSARSRLPIQLRTQRRLILRRRSSHSSLTTRLNPACLHPFTPPEVPVGRRLISTSSHLRPLRSSVSALSLWASTRNTTRVGRSNTISTR